MFAEVQGVWPISGLIRNIIPMLMADSKNVGKPLKNGRPIGWSGAEVGVGMLRGFLVVWFLGFWFLGILVSKFCGFLVFGFLVLKFQGFIKLPFHY